MTNLSSFASYLHFILRTQEVPLDEFGVSRLSSLEGWEETGDLLSESRAK